MAEMTEIEFEPVDLDGLEIPEDPWRSFEAEQESWAKKTVKVDSLWAELSLADLQQTLRFYRFRPLVRGLKTPDGPGSVQIATARWSMVSSNNPTLSTTYNWSNNPTLSTTYKLHPEALAVTIRVAPDRYRFGLIGEVPVFLDKVVGELLAEIRLEAASRLEAVRFQAESPLRGGARQ